MASFAFLLPVMMAIFGGVFAELFGAGRARRDSGRSAIRLPLPASAFRNCFQVIGGATVIDSKV